MDLERSRGDAAPRSDLGLAVGGLERSRGEPRSDCGLALGGPAGAGDARRSERGLALGDLDRERDGERDGERDAAERERDRERDDADLLGDLLLDAERLRRDERLCLSPLFLCVLDGDLDCERDGECESPRRLATGEYEGEPRRLFTTGLLDRLLESPL